jgi:EAL domain-containing protein (putative c-di-GMP-specific phosphodiesterase class I)
VRDIHTDPNDAAIVAAIIAMGHVLKLGVVAEGVESESQLNFLRLQACDAAQGFFIAQPGTADEIGPLLGQLLPQSHFADAQDPPNVKPISERTG